MKAFSIEELAVSIFDPHQQYAMKTNMGKLRSSIRLFGHLQSLKSMSYWVLLGT